MSHRDELQSGLFEAFELFPPRPGQVLIVGCSTSEVLGSRIGSASSMPVAREIMEALAASVEKWGISLALQCCEHLNRALVLERRLLEQQGLLEVLAVPQVCAGGALASIAHERLCEPCLAETIQADYGVDIGSTLIGMHLRRVAVPVKISQRRVGAATLTIARTRPPLIGGKRAQLPGESPGLDVPA